MCDRPDIFERGHARAVHGGMIVLQQFKWTRRGGHKRCADQLCRNAAVAMRKAPEAGMGKSMLCMAEHSSGRSVESRVSM
jgi:hypothetical protein